MELRWLFITFFGYFAGRYDERRYLNASGRIIDEAPTAAVMRGLQLMRSHLDDDGHDWTRGTDMADVEAARAWLDSRSTR